MDESADEGLRLRELLPKVSDIGRVNVSGFVTENNTRLIPRADVESSLRKHFTSCGEITDVFVLWRYAYIYLLGEGAVDKALQLNGSDVG